MERRQQNREELEYEKGISDTSYSRYAAPHGHGVLCGGSECRKKAILLGQLEWNP